LRGCVGQIVSDKPLYETVAEAAIAAATRDPRFHRANLSEMPELEIEISVLTPLQPLERIEDLEIGVHGLYIKHGEHSGLLLPQVATAHNWNRTQFLQQACKKAKLPEEAWQDSETEIYLFGSQVFGEEP
jgi:AmmeMemoRadiSam system protein A